MENKVTWTDELLKDLYQLRAVDGRPYKAIAHALNLKHTVTLTDDACRKKFRAYDWTKHGPVDAAGEAHDVQVEKVLDSVADKQELTVARTAVLTDLFEKAIEALPQVKKCLWKPAKKLREDRSEDVGIILSDLHVGHSHSLEDTGGISEYNFDIFTKRFANLRKALDGILDLHSTLYKLPTLRIFSLGDIVAGMNDVGSWSPLFINTPIVDQAVQGFDAIASFVNYYLTRFEHIEFYGISGNHGRAASDGVQKEHDNWDFVCHKFLQTAFRNNPRVKFHIPKSWWYMDTIRGHNFLMVHGHNLRSGGGVPVKRLADFSDKMAIITKRFPDYTLAGHFHNTATLGTSCGKAIINGSFVGPDVFCLKDIHVGGKAEQKVFGIGDKHGITWSYDINLDKERE
jgi:hypothetical protein